MTVTTKTLSLCPGCDKGFYPTDLVAPKNCFHASCLKCMTEWLKKKDTCPICRGEVKKIEDCKSVQTYFEIFAYHVLQQNPDPRINEIVTHVQTNEVPVECPNCIDVEFPAIYYHDQTRRFWHEKCLNDQASSTTSETTDEPAQPLSATLQPLYPRHIVEVAQTLEAPPSPKKAPLLRMPFFDKRPYLRAVLIAVAIVSVLALVINKLGFRNQHPVLFVLGLPALAIAKLLYLLASGLKTAMTEVH
jgi:hypothetical protein